MGTYELIPVDGRKSFYGKAVVRVHHDGAETLQSYGTNVMRRDADGTLHRLWSGWSMTTGRHIKAFCGMGTAEWNALPVEHDDYLTRLIMDRAAMG